MKWDTRLAGRTAKMKASAIREILKVASRPGMVSLAGCVIAVEAPTYLGALQAYVGLDRMKTALCRHRSKQLSRGRA
jgi:hypothetical protein